MANKAAVKGRNSDRRNGKAWGKEHNVLVIIAPTQEQQERKAHKLAEREKRRAVRVAARREPGPAYTMPKINWEWAAETLAGRHQNTRRYRMVGACMAQDRGRSFEDPTAPVETNPEVKSSKSKKNGK